jgi:hypothetical protein
MHQCRCIRRGLVGLALAASLPLFAQAPGPVTGSAAAADTAALLREVRKRIPLDVEFQSGYVCVQRETDDRLDSDGHQTSRSIREYELYPAAGGNPPLKRLIARDGVPLSPEELAGNDRRRQAELAASPRDRDKRLQHEAEERRERQALMDEVFRLFDFRITAREVLNGRPALLVSFTPRAGQTASTRAASVAQKFAGKAWVDEQDLQVVRVEARSAEDVDYGYGMFARVFKGTTVLWERQKVDDGAWVPARLEIRADARVLLFRRLGLHRVTDYLDYRRLSSGTASSR